LSLLIFNRTRDFDNELDSSAVDNFSASESESGDSDNEDPHASDSEATAGAVEPIGMSSSSSGIHQVDEAV